MTDPDFIRAIEAENEFMAMCDECEEAERAWRKPALWQRLRETATGLTRAIAAAFEGRK